MLAKEKAPATPEADKDKALARALRLWHSEWSLGGDSSDPYIQLVLRAGHELPVGGVDFDHYSRQLYAQLLEQAEAL